VCVFTMLIMLTGEEPSNQCWNSWYHIAARHESENGRSLLQGANQEMPSIRFKAVLLVLVSCTCKKLDVLRSEDLLGVIPVQSFSFLACFCSGSLGFLLLGLCGVWGFFVVVGFVFVVFLIANCRNSEASAAVQPIRIRIYYVKKLVLRG